MRQVKPRAPHLLFPLLLSLLIFGLGLGCSKNTPGEGAVRPPVKYYDPDAPVATAPSTSEQAAPQSASEPPATASQMPADCNNAPGQLFLPSAPWNQPINGASLASDSDTVIRFLQKNHEKKHRFAIDFSLVTLETTHDTQRRAFVPNQSHYTPDCDLAPVPLVSGGRVEGNRGYVCESQGDCHLLVIDRPHCRLYELFKASLLGNTLEGGCLAVWDLLSPYPETGRGEHCTSADAAGLPITPLLFNADEIASGEIKHAVRMIIHNRLIRKKIYVRPATHSTGATKGPDEAPPYGALFRLKANTPIDHLTSGAQVLARALKKYGMYIADGGTITFTAASDDYTQHKWSEVGLGARDLQPLEWTDFELVDTGPRMKYTGNCRRQQVIE